eukprot:c9761_g1_i1.p1 GENE.c9761_g1_i1~~c9761_g1_i1.p1  ORF type:complete len:1181 (-),score=341.01 c9761_g1_i1:192-3734(-)
MQSRFAFVLVCVALVAHASFVPSWNANIHHDILQALLATTSKLTSLSDENTAEMTKAQKDAYELLGTLKTRVLAEQHDDDSRFSFESRSAQTRMNELKEELGAVEAEVGLLQITLRGTSDLDSSRPITAAISSMVSQGIAAESASVNQACRTAVAQHLHLHETLDKLASSTSHLASVIPESFSRKADSFALTHALSSLADDLSTVSSQELSESSDVQCLCNSRIQRVSSHHNSSSSAKKSLALVSKSVDLVQVQVDLERKITLAEVLASTVSELETHLRDITAEAEERKQHRAQTVSDIEKLQALLVMNIHDSNSDTVASSSSESIVAQLSTTFGTTKAKAGRDCAHILEYAPGSRDGVYWVLLGASSSEDAVRVYCDMTTDGGGWTIAWRGEAGKASSHIPDNEDEDENVVVLPLGMAHVRTTPITLEERISGAKQDKAFNSKDIATLAQQAKLLVPNTDCTTKRGTNTISKACGLDSVQQCIAFCALDLDCTHWTYNYGKADMELFAGSKLTESVWSDGCCVAMRSTPLCKERTFVVGKVSGTVPRMEEYLKSHNAEMIPAVSTTAKRAVSLLEISTTTTTDAPSRSSFNSRAFEYFASYPYQEALKTMSVVATESEAVVAQQIVKVRFNAATMRHVLEAPMSPACTLLNGTLEVFSQQPMTPLGWTANGPAPEDMIYIQGVTAARTVGLIDSLPVEIRTISRTTSSTKCCCSNVPSATSPIVMGRKVDYRVGSTVWLHSISSLALGDGVRYLGPATYSASLAAMTAMNEQASAALLPSSDATAATSGVCGVQTCRQDAVCDFSGLHTLVDYSPATRLQLTNEGGDVVLADLFSNLVLLRSPLLEAEEDAATQESAVTSSESSSTSDTNPFAWHGFVWGFRSQKCGRSDAGVCDLHGACERGACKCMAGWSGPTCNKPLCPRGCGSAGTCVAPAKCSCPPSFVGDQCEQPVLCSPPPSPTANNATTNSNDDFPQVDCDGFQVNSVCRLSCAPGRVIEGTFDLTSVTRVCLTSGIWSGSATLPRCVVSSCPVIPAPVQNLAIQMTCSGNKIGDSCKFSCVAGYEFTATSIANATPNTTASSDIEPPTPTRQTLTVDEISMQCQRTGLWSGSVPQCERRSCGRLYAPRFSTGECTATMFGDVCEFGCRSGYVAKAGPLVFTCQANGDWLRPPAARCYAIE